MCGALHQMLFSDWLGNNTDISLYYKLISEPTKRDL